MKDLAFHSLLRWNIIILPILTVSLIHFSLQGWGNVLFTGAVLVETILTPHAHTEAKYTGIMPVLLILRVKGLTAYIRKGYRGLPINNTIFMQILESQENLCGVKSVDTIMKKLWQVTTEVGKWSSPRTNPGLDKNPNLSLPFGQPALQFYSAEATSNSPKFSQRSNEPWKFWTTLARRASDQWNLLPWATGKSASPRLSDKDFC